MDYTDKHSINQLVGGGLAGSISWLITYPIDVLKTRYITYPELFFNKSNIYNMIFNKSLFNGLSYCLLRAFLANGIGYYVYKNYSSINF